MQPGKDAVGQKPADHVTLSAAEGEAMIARLAVYAPSRADCEILIQVVRWYFSHSTQSSGKASMLSRILLKL
jgi:hypothetical protein